LRSRFDVPESIPARIMPSNVRHHLYLAAKEVLHNIVKHANASEVSLQVEFPENECVIVISDDGRGFEEGAAAIDADGLINMRDRLEKIHGTCTRRSMPGHGTAVEMRVPMAWRDGRADTLGKPPSPGI
jgi:signal transduction histidine kinase